MNIDKKITENIDNVFSLLKDNIKSKDNATKILSSSLNSLFKDYNFIINVFPSKDEYYFMSIIPEISTIEKIINNLMQDPSGDLKPSTIKMMKDLWKKNKKWIIEIDERVLPLFSERELTAMLLHEIGHVVSANAVSTRLLAIIQYELSKAGIEGRAILKHGIFQKLLSIPFLSICIVGDAKISSKNLKEEIKADDFAKKSGYRTELITALEKLQKNNTKNFTKEEALQKTMDFSTGAAHQFQIRQAHLVKESMEKLIENCESEVIKGYLTECYDDFFFVSEGSLLMNEDKKISFLYEKCDEAQNNYITEFFNIGTRTLKRIDPAEIDYILIKTDMMKTESDKLMLVSYIHNKLDTVDYYMEILKNPKMKNKYKVPYSFEELQSLHNKLEKMIQTVIEYKLPDPMRGLLVAYPTGYEG